MQLERRYRRVFCRFESCRFLYCVGWHNEHAVGMMVIPLPPVRHSFLKGVAMSENWIILLGVICARNYEEFDRAYSLLKRGKKAPKKSSVDLWKVISGQMPSLNSEALKRLYERRKNEKK